MTVYIIKMEIRTEVQGAHILELSITRKKVALNTSILYTYI